MDTGHTDRHICPGCHHAWDLHSILGGCLPTCQCRQPVPNQPDRPDPIRWRPEPNR